MFDYRKLTGRIIEKFGTREKFSEAVGTPRAQVSKILNGKTFMKNTEVDRWAETLEIPLEDIGTYFFTKLVHEDEHGR